MAYKPGDVVIENDPFALAVLDKMIPMVCSWCLKPATKTSQRNPLSLCGGCKTLKYCSPACQKEDWSKGPHKKECKYLKKNVPNDQVRLLARCDHWWSFFFLFVYFSSYTRDWLFQCIADRLFPVFPNTIFCKNPLYEGEPHKVKFHRGNVSDKSKLRK